VLSIATPTARLRLQHSLVAIPALYLGVAALLGVVAPEIDRQRDSPGVLDEGVASARDVLTSTATGMIAFTGFVVAGLLVVVQFAAGQYSPRLVLWFRRDALIKHAIGCFLASFLYALVALWWLERRAADVSPDVTVGIALVLLASAAVLFLALLQRVTDRLRPRSLYAAVIGEGIRAARETYPMPLGENDSDDGWRRADPALVSASRPGVVVAIDRSRLIAAAVRADATIELVPAVGEFVGPGEALLCVHGGEAPDVATLRAAVVIADERTIEQDPAFAIRIAVDTAIRALSPAVNDPTTAVHGLDVLELIVRDLAARDLEASLARDGDGTVRLVWPTPSWPDILDLAFDEIRHYGAESVQVCRRLRAVLDDLRATTVAVRHAAIDDHLRRLEATVRTTLPDEPIALVADATGLGHARR
jgi:uncharacterized membrane protein